VDYRKLSSWVALARHHVTGFERCLVHGRRDLQELVLRQPLQEGHIRKGGQQLLQIIFLPYLLCNQ